MSKSKKHNRARKRASLGRMSTEQLIVHRELQYLRVCGTGSTRKHIAYRHEKLAKALEIKERASATEISG